MAPPVRHLVARVVILWSERVFVEKTYLRAKVRGGGGNRAGSESVSMSQIEMSKLWIGGGVVYFRPT